MPAFEHGDAGAEPRRLQRHRQPGKAGADHAMSTSRSNDSRERSRKAAASGPSVVLVEVSLMSFSYALLTSLGRLSPCPERLQLVRLILRT